MQLTLFLQKSIYIVSDFFSDLSTFPLNILDLFFLLIQFYFSPIIIAPFKQYCTFSVEVELWWAQIFRNSIG